MNYECQCKQGKQIHETMCYVHDQQNTQVKHPFSYLVGITCMYMWVRCGGRRDDFSRRSFFQHMCCCLIVCGGMSSAIMLSIDIDLGTILAPLTILFHPVTHCSFHTAHFVNVVQVATVPTFIVWLVLISASFQFLCLKTSLRAKI